MALRQVFMSNMKKWRKQMGFTQERLAELCNSDPCYIRQIEIGNRFPSVDFIEKIAKALKIAPYQLFFDETYPESAEFLSSHREQKQKLKAMLIENITHICSMIDEGY